MSLDDGCAFSVDADDNSRSESSNSVAKDPITPPIAPTSKFATHYNMNHPKRGLALIFNHEIFEIPDLGRRFGTNIDCNNLKNTLKKFGFEINVHENKNLSDIEKILENVAQMDHTDHDCLMIVVLSHGKQGVLYAQDTAYKTGVIWKNFSADKCPTLAGKPKLFIVQACRGTQMDAGAILRARTETDGHRSNTNYRIPKYADFLLAHSSVHGFSSFRNAESGSWFIEALCQELNENGFKYDIMRLLTFASQRVALNYESYNTGDPTINQKKQMPCITTMLTRILVFSRSSNGDENGNNDILE